MISENVFKDRDSRKLAEEIHEVYRVYELQVVFDFMNCFKLLTRESKYLDWLVNKNNNNRQES